MLRRHRPIDASHAVVGDSAHVVRFRAGPKEPLYLAWSDAPDGSAVTLQLDGLGARRACITPAVADADGRGITAGSWIERFPSRGVEIGAGRLALTLPAKPLWITGDCP